MAKAIRKANPTAEENDDADKGSDEEAEKDLQDDGDSQTRGDEAPQGDGGSNGSTEHAYPDESPSNAAENPSEVGQLLGHSYGRR